VTFDGTKKPSGDGKAASLRRRLRRLRAVADAAALIHSTLDLAVIAERIVATAVRLIGAERGSIFLVDEASAGLVSLVAQGVNGKPLRVARA
jgi:GAF domain-containing protein